MGCAIAMAFDPAQAEQAFIAESRAVFFQWTVLRLAVQNSWGGGNAAEKEEALLNEVLGLFGKAQQAGKKVYADEIQEVLDSALNEDFETVPDDGSTKEVANHLITLYND